eukprot:COSAG01_NODE_9925_length_2300_cov_5.144025_4_plen_74_part_00
MDFKVYMLATVDMTGRIRAHTSIGTTTGGWVDVDPGCCQPTFGGVDGLQPRVARPKSTNSYCFQGVVGVHSAS